MLEGRVLVAFDHRQHGASVAAHPELVVAAHAPEVDEPDPSVGLEEVVPGVGIGVEHAVAKDLLVVELAEGEAGPRAHSGLDLVHVGVDVGAGEALQGQHPLGRQFGVYLRDVHAGVGAVDALVGLDVGRFLEVVELFFEALAQLGEDVVQLVALATQGPTPDQDGAQRGEVCRDRLVDAAVEHLDDHVVAVGGAGCVHLSEAGGAERFGVELGEGFGEGDLEGRFDVLADGLEGDGGGGGVQPRELAGHFVGQVELVGVQRHLLPDLHRCALELPELIDDLARVVDVEPIAGPLAQALVLDGLADPLGDVLAGDARGETAEARDPTETAGASFRHGVRLPRPALARHIGVDMTGLPHEELTVYKLALDLAVRADELAEQLPQEDLERGIGIVTSTRALAVAVACAALPDSTQTFDDVRVHAAEVAVEFDLFSRRAFVTGVDEARAMLAAVVAALP